jgi:hypothetical protein
MRAMAAALTNRKEMRIAISVGNKKYNPCIFSLRTISFKTPI